MAETVTKPTGKKSANGIRPQSLIFTLYGDYVHSPSNHLSIRSLIRLLALFGISESAVRTTVSRMARRGWLALERTGNTSAYVLTPNSRGLIQEGTGRIFNTPTTPPPWNHCWHLVTYAIPEERRAARDQFRRELGWLGYGMLTNTVWVSPRNQRVRVETLAARLDIEPFVQAFSAESEGFTPCAELAARCWNLGDLNAAYAAFIASHAPALEQYRTELDAGREPDDSQCFARRLLLIHEYRKFPYRDPYLPLELLPQAWQGWQAATLFQEYHDLLAVGANRFFEAVVGSSRLT